MRTKNLLIRYMNGLDHVLDESIVIATALFVPKNSSCRFSPSRGVEVLDLSPDTPRETLAEIPEVDLGRCECSATELLTDWLGSS